MSTSSRILQAVVSFLREHFPDRAAARDTIYARARDLGLFRLARSATRGRLRILCYHAFSATDEHEFDPFLFMRPGVFAGRLDLLRASDATVLDLDEALSRLRHGALPDLPVVMTFDDGFVSTLELWQRTMAGRMPGTLYVASQNLGRTVFDVAFRYMAWRSERTELRVDGLELPAGERLGAVPVEQAVDFVVEAGPELRSHAHAHAVLTAVGERLDADFPALDAGKRLSVASPEELSAAAGAGLDLQLHSHTHRFPAEPDRIRAEIAENRAALVDLARSPLVHFCYPSGFWRRDHWATLTEEGIESATTCDAGLSTSETPLLALSRFVDADHLSRLTFEAELSGFAALLRTARTLVSA